MLPVFFLILTFSKCLDAACTFPSTLIGSWQSSTLGSFTINSTSISTIPYEGGQYTFECYLQNANRYVIKSEVIRSGLLESVAYTCLDIQSVSGSTDKLLYYQVTAEVSGKGRFVPAAVSSVPVESDVCTETSVVQPGAYSFLIKDGSLSTAKIKCPDGLVSEFNVTLSNCPDGAHLDVCTDNTIMDFNFSTCGGSTYSGEVKYTCVYSSESGNLTYVTLYNSAASVPSNPFIPFSCVVFTAGDNDTTLTHNPGDCLATQTDTVITSPGFAYGAN
ncbi:uncharacterized protein LOC121380233 [Gigantopelta aegis]|uniref:uncharacterized protein LOC121380233 n=1 Tax=Gigantopelta aegis TaxID=1735272 RepID=UPI001B887575|nr:uncharacterized protein LOC121380233 [Gigantopelta aegis]